MLIAFLAQATKAPGTGGSSSKALDDFTIVFWLIVLFMLGASAWVTRDAVKFYGQRGALVGFALFGCILGTVAAWMLVGLGKLEFGIVTGTIMFGGGGGVWLIILIVYTIVSMRDKKLDAIAEANRAAAEERLAAANPMHPYGDAGTVPAGIHVTPPVAPAPLTRPGLSNTPAPGTQPAPQFAPRASLPKPAPARAAAPTGEPKPPRASEVDGNPILPDGEVTIRSLCCMAKMRNQGEKFAKQRRCPGCGVEPFRFKLA